MKKNEAPAVAAATDLRPKNLVRQLDFSMMCGNALLPEHPQTQLQSKLLALAKSRAPPPEIQTQSPVKSGVKRKLQSHALPEPPKVVPVVPRPVLPAHPQLHPRSALPLVQSQRHPRPTLPLIASQSPKSRQRYNVDLKETTPKKQKQCNCRNSRCLKLYCECFASGTYCDGCNCTNCQNNTENEVARREAIGSILERNSNAFRPKIANSPNGSHDDRERNEEVGEIKGLGRHNKGCNCKKSGCLKKYCECFQGGIMCSENCKCMDCKNFEGSGERNALLNGNYAHSATFTQIAANAAINGAIGSFGYGVPQAMKNTKDQQLLFGSVLSNDQSNNSTNRFLQENCRTSSDASSTLLFATTSPESSKVRNRSPLADIIKPQDVKELCSLLVTVSAEVTKAQPDERAKMIPKESYPASVQEEESSVTNSGGAQMYACRSDRQAGLQNKREMSPGTLALLCDEKDPMFNTADSPTRLICSSEKTEKIRRSMNEVYAEKEGLILTHFRNYLSRLLTRESMREPIHDSPAKHDAGSQQ